MSNETANKETESSMVLAVPEATITALDKAAQNGVIAQNVASQFKKMFMLGAVMQELKKLLTPEVMQPIMALQNSPIGFMTDRPCGYDIDTVRDAVIEAAVNGVSVCGNEFNLLAKRCYVTKNGMKHKLRDIPDLYKNVTPGIPKIMSDKGAVVRMHIDWTYRGKHNTVDLDLAIRVNSGMGADAIIGKATRKAYAWLYEEVTGNSVPEGEVADMEPIEVTVSPLETAPQVVAGIEQQQAPATGCPDELPM